jgi:hypothetical protein
MGTVTLCAPEPALAHGDPASVLEVGRVDRDGLPVLVRLSEGMALRANGHARYLCPALFDSEDETPRAAALPTGPTLVASRAGAYLLLADGTVEPHPDAALRGDVIRALEAGPSGVYALRSTESGAELLALDAERAEVLASLPADFSSLAVEDSGLLVAGLSPSARVLQRGFGADGAAREEWSAEAAASLDAVAVFARLADGQPYLLVAAANALGSELARLDDAGGYQVVQRAGGAISGPIAVDARTWLAFDGQLAELRDDGEVARADDAGLVTCVGRAGALRYACTGTELVRLEASGLGERLFGLDEIEPPDLSGLADELAERCELQWLRFRVDLVRAGVTPLDDGAEPTPPGGAERDGGRGDDGGARDAGREHDASGEDGGCAVGRSGVRGSAHGAERSSGLCAVWVAALGLNVRRRRRAHGRP